MSEEINNTWELAEMLEHFAELLEHFAEMLKKQPKYNLKDYKPTREVIYNGASEKTINDPLDFEIKGGPIYKADPETIKEYGTEPASPEEERPFGKAFRDAEIREAKARKILMAIFKDLKDLKFTPVETDLIKSETFQMYGTDLIIPELEDIEIFQRISPVCYRCKCCKSYFDFDDFDKDGKCPHCHGKTKIGDKIYECDDTEVID